jgi:hydroxymethylpyrimidine/phosphomethylpyrimidine kinase
MCEAIAQAKRFITEAIRSGADVVVGGGSGPVNHGFNPQKMIINE